MKKLIFIIAVVFLSSCTKTYECTIETVVTGDDPNVVTYIYEFKGTKQEMKDFEESGHSTSSGLGNNTITQTTNCK